ncbi:nuclear transport factor 2 family protein [Roseomonas sp. KE2513]|uniref:nuclear transport factor 2 family protein n=1 Tax=Roseomonas sp. KE2513 TaxID=2479202 RepID=UPI0018DEF937|nr:nuclear transport factor 2 family protein [Roseomonas sp. KE2513]
MPTHWHPRRLPRINAEFLAEGFSSMNTAHVDNYFAALSKRDSLRIVPHLAENVVLLGPIFPGPTIGKDAVVEVLSGFLETIDSLEVNLRFASLRIGTSPCSLASSATA